MADEATRRRHSLRRRERLRKRREFTRVLAEGRSFAAYGIRFRYAPNGLAWSRLGLTVGRRVAPKAVQRNRIRRVLREGYRAGKHRLPRPVDIVVAPAPRVEITLARVTRAFAALARAMRARAGKEGP